MSEKSKNKDFQNISQISSIDKKRTKKNKRKKKSHQKDDLFSNKYNLKENEKINLSDDLEIDLEYEDEYQGLMYYSKNNDIDNFYYYMEKDNNNNYKNNFQTKWKTEICRYWDIYGQCKFGDNCAFAHGDSELKARKMTFNYKTKPCKQFFELGYCSYGSRCQFSHKNEDLKNADKNNKISYLKIIKEFLSSDNEISHELVKRPRLMTFEKIIGSTLEESEKSKLELYEDIINIKNSKCNNLEDTDYSNSSIDKN